MADRRRTDFPFLADASARLSRLLGIGGQLSPRFDPEPELVPVIITGDATLPGYGSRSGRRFGGFGVLAPGAFVSSVGIKAVEDVIILRSQSDTSTGGTMQLFYLGVNDADPFVMATAGRFPFIDRSLSGLDVAPLLHGTELANTAVAPLPIAKWAANNASLGTSHEWPCFPLFLPAGAKLIWQCSTISMTVNHNLYGCLP